MRCRLWKTERGELVVAQYVYCLLRSKFSGSLAQFQQSLRIARRNLFLLLLRKLRDPVEPFWTLFQGFVWVVDREHDPGNLLHFPVTLDFVAYLSIPISWIA